MEDEEVLNSLGASAVVASEFEEKFFTRLEEQLKSDDEKEDGELDEEVAEGGDGGDGDDKEKKEEDQPKVTFQMGSSFLMKALTAPKKEITPKPQLKKPLPTKVKKKVIKIPEQEETEVQRKIRNGEMTPFGTEIAGGSGGQASSSAFMNLDKYLKQQLELQKNRRQLASKTGKQADNRYADDDSSTKKGKSRRRVVSLDDSDEDANNNEPSTPTPGTSKSALNYKVMFPKKRKRKEKVGAATSSDPYLQRIRPGKTAGETASMYLNPSDDSDYYPSDNHSSDDSQPIREKSCRPKTKRIKSVKENSSDENSDWLSGDSEDGRPLKRRSKKEADDGSHQHYLKRVQAWKEKETRFGKMHELHDGFKLPSYLWDQIYNYQKVGVKWLWELHQQRVGGILGDEMGLGKTIQVITFLTGISCSNLLFRHTNYRGLGPSIIVCPATVMHQWVKEFHKWWPPFRVAILHESGSYSGSKHTLIKSIQDSSGILITSYVGIVTNQNDLLRYSWHYVILDEGHKIRNPDAQATLTVKQFSTPHRIILSGSPLQNNLKELWSLFDFVYPGKLGTLPAFQEQFAVPITLGGYSNASEIQVATAFKCATILRDIINPYLLRRMKQDVKNHLNLPEKNEQVLFCKMTNDQKGLYINYINSKEIDSIVQGRFNLFVGLINLRKICNHPNLFDGGPKMIQSAPKAKAGMKDEEDEGSDIDLDPEDSFGHWSKSGKMIVVETLLKLWHKQNHKVLLFTQSRQMLCILENFVKQQSYKYLRMDGSTSIGSRQPLITKFNEDPDLFVFLLTTRVGGLGVNLTGANRIIIYDPDWNPSTDMQARERAWRIGQEREVTIYRLITSGTIEEKMYHRQIFKQFLTNRVLKDPRQKRFFKSNDLLELFSFNEGSDGKGTESEALFAGTGSKVKVKKKAREKRGKFKDVPNLVKQRKGDGGGGGEEDEKLNKQQDEYVLAKLFRKSGVEAALRHDKIVDTDEADYMLVEQEAERVAKEAALQLKKSREECWSADSGQVNWTGQHGQRKEGTSKPRFGAKKVATITKKQDEPEVKKAFAGPKLEESKEDIGPISSGDLLAIIRARNKPIGEPLDDAGGSVGGGGGSNLKPEYKELFGDIHNYISFQATVDGQATTAEIVDRFRERLPPEKTPLFKKMLGQLCTFRKVEGQGIWRLKPEFR